MRIAIVLRIPGISWVVRSVWISGIIRRVGRIARIIWIANVIRFAVILGGIQCLLNPIFGRLRDCDKQLCQHILMVPLCGFQQGL